MRTLFGSLLCVLLRSPGGIKNRILNGLGSSRLASKHVANIRLLAQEQRGLGQDDTPWEATVFSDTPMRTDSTSHAPANAR